MGRKEGVHYGLCGEARLGMLEVCVMNRVSRRLAAALEPHRRLSPVIGLRAMRNWSVRRQGEFCHRRGLETLAPISGSIVLKCHGRNNTVMGHFLCALTVLTTAASGAGSCIFFVAFVL